MPLWGSCCALTSALLNNLVPNASQIMVKRAASKRSQRVPRLVQTMPDMLRTQLRFASLKTLTASSAGVAVSAVFRANDLYDPDASVGGHQPVGFDQLCAFYSSFRVESSRIALRPGTSSTASVNPGWYGVFLSNTGTYCSGTTINTIVEQPTSRCSKPLIIGQSQPCLWKPAKFSFDVRQFFGPVSRDKDLACTASASPDLQAYFECFLAPTDASASTGAVDFLIEIEYNVICYDRLATIPS